MNKNSKLLITHMRNDIGRILGEYEGEFAVNTVADETLTTAEVQTLVTVRELLDRFETVEA